MATIVPLDQMRRIELLRLTEDNGFGLPQGEADGWARFTGLAIPHTLHVARNADGNWLVGMVHAGVMETLTTDQRADAVSRPDGGVAVAVAELSPMIRRMARLARSLPTAPLDTGTGTSQYPGMHAACQAAFGDQARMCRLGTAEKLQISVYHPPLPPLGDGILQIAHSSWKGRRWLQSTKRFATNSTR